ncbi:hypothetical protein MKW98_001289 [Papaver atlanticum]|uniref:DIS3-like exonuclease 2 n=1 Tax=Papaver atlanticum TaxID=357466 RepID=A0AAD4SU65_9MAGN|nr:hypothetical protein MKW98_001289 [Papaver atlanticum]
MMNRMSEQFGATNTEEADSNNSSNNKEKKKKRRSNRRSKQLLNCSGVCHSSLNGINEEASVCFSNGNTSNEASSSLGLNVGLLNDQGLARASDVAFSSLPTNRNNDQVVEFRSMPPQLPLENGQSSPPHILREETNEPLRNKDFVSPCKNGTPPGNQRSFFVPHLSEQAVSEAVEKGEVFITPFRVNAHNPAEAYCTVSGVPIDILINDFPFQNRALEGDTVAIKLDPLAYWTRLRGSVVQGSTSAQTGDGNMSCGVADVVAENCKGKEKLDSYCEGLPKNNDLVPAELGLYHEDRSQTIAVHPELGIMFGNYKHGSEGQQPSSPHEHKEISDAIEKICGMVKAYPFKRPTGRVVAIVNRSPRRDSVVGFLGVKQWVSSSNRNKKETKKKNGFTSFADREHIQLTPNHAKLPRMLVCVKSLPDCIKQRLEKGDVDLEMDLVAARISDWKEDCLLPQAEVLHVLGRGGEIGSQIAAILFENTISNSEFSSEALSFLPGIPWELPKEEVAKRKDLRDLCTFTIDPSTSIDLDDALSVQRISDDIFRVGIHISDVSYFVPPGTALDMEAQTRSTCTYLRQQKLSMLPPLLSENMGSLNPGVDKFTFSIICDINLSGDVVCRWLGRTVIHSCCKLSYQHAQDIIDGLADSTPSGNGYPKLYGQFEWKHIVRSVKSLYEISKRLKENRFKDGALDLESSKLGFSFDESGFPQDSTLLVQKASNSLVEELMILANRTVAEVISRAFPDAALLRRHPAPNVRKLKEFETFCQKYGLELDTSSSGGLQLSLERIKEKMKNDDPGLFGILKSSASKPMQLASYFSTGEFKNKQSDWNHYALAIPQYTHFTSPLRRYPDIVVHRTLNAVIEAEDMCLQHQRMWASANKCNSLAIKCFTGIDFDEDILGTQECREALHAAALKHQILCPEALAEVAAYCNRRMMASKYAEDACDKIFLWAMLKKRQTLVTEARVLGLGPKFMSVYIPKLAMERRINYDEVDGLTTEWLETTSTLIIDICTKYQPNRRYSPGRYRPLEDVVWIISPCDADQDRFVCDNSTRTEVGRVPLVGEEYITIKQSDHEVLEINDVEPACFPLTLRLFSTITVALHAVGGDDGPPDVGARLYLSSYYG